MDRSLDWSALSSGSQFDAFRLALRALDGQVVSFDQRHASQLMPIVFDLAQGREVTDARLKALSRPSPEASFRGETTQLVPSAKGGKFDAYVSMHGAALYNLDFQPFCFSTLKLSETVTRLANDPVIETIVLDINSPGGAVTGTQEAGDAVWNARKRGKNIVGLVNPLCASAAYWIGSQCSALIGVPSADVGSVGVFLLHLDFSGALADAGVKPTFIFAGENKTEGNFYEPLSAGAKDFYQSDVNEIYRQFLATVSRGRGVPVGTVRSTFGGGRCFDARKALSLNMIDAIATRDAAVRSISAGKKFASAITSKTESRAISEKPFTELSPEARRAHLAILSAT